MPVLVLFQWRSLGLGWIFLHTAAGPGPGTRGPGKPTQCTLADSDTAGPPAGHGAAGLARTHAADALRLPARLRPGCQPECRRPARRGDSGSPDPPESNSRPRAAPTRDTRRAGPGPGGSGTGRPSNHTHDAGPGGAELKASCGQAPGTVGRGAAGPAWAPSRAAGAH